jgi:hypothetical protein
MHLSSPNQLALFCSPISWRLAFYPMSRFHTSFIPALVSDEPVGNVLCPANREHAYQDLDVIRIISRLIVVALSRPDILSFYIFNPLKSSLFSRIAFRVCAVITTARCSHILWPLLH